MGKIREDIFFGGQEDQPLIPPKKDRGKSGSSYKTTRQCPFLLGIKPRGCVSAWGQCGWHKGTTAADGTWPSYFPLLKYFTTIYYFDLAASTLGFAPTPIPPASFSASGGYWWFVMPA